MEVDGERRLRLRFTLPEFIPTELVYQIEVSDDLDEWTVSYSERSLEIPG